MENDCVLNLPFCLFSQFCIILIEIFERKLDVNMGNRMDGISPGPRLCLYAFPLIAPGRSREASPGQGSSTTSSPVLAKSGSLT